MCHHVTNFLFISNMWCQKNVDLASPLWTKTPKGLYAHRGGSCAKEKEKRKELLWEQQQFEKAKKQQLNNTKKQQSRKQQSLSITFWLNVW